MLTYPIRFNRDPYGGSNPAKRWRSTERNELIWLIERHLNQTLATAPAGEHLFFNYEIAVAIGRSPESVDNATALSGWWGHNGGTIAKR